ncbi:MAG: phosphoribosylanthranilate isomerase [Pseudomonadota bacterium]
MFIKICGIKTFDAIDCACDSYTKDSSNVNISAKIIQGPQKSIKATHLGFNFVPQSPRFVSLDQAVLLRDYIKNRAQTVAVLIDPDDLQIIDIVAKLKPDYIQLHGGETCERIKEIKQVSKCGIIKAFSIKNNQTVMEAKKISERCDFILLDAPAPVGQAYSGGHGVTFDTTLLKEVSFDCPWFLAGGLTPENVVAMCKKNNPDGVDVASGVEHIRGHKSPQLIARFLQNIANYLG